MRHAGKAFVINGRTAGTPGPATTSPVVVDIPGDVANRTFTGFVYLRHLSGDGALRVILDDQAYITIKPDEVREIPVSVASITVLTSYGTVEYEALVVV